MPFDLIQLINQIKSFLKLEKGTFLSLFVLLIVAFLTYNLLFGMVVKYYPKADFTEGYIIVAIILFFVWLSSTFIKNDKNKVNIGLALFDIVDLDPKNPHNSDVKYNIAEELSHYIYARLTRGSYAYEFSKMVNVVKLPPRYKFNRDSEKTSGFNSKFELVLSGQLFFQENGMFIDPQLIFIAELKDQTFNFFRESFSKDNRFTFKPDGSVNLAFDKLIHEIFYIGVTYQFVKLSHKGKCVEAEELSNRLLKEINALYESEDQSVNIGDKDFAYIEAIILLYKAKNLHKYGNQLLFDHERADEARSMYEKAAQYLLDRSDVLKRVLTEESEVVDKEARDLSYIYSIGLLSKESAEEKGEHLLKKLEKDFQDKNNYKLAQAVFAEKREHIDEALKKYTAIIKVDPNNKYALRRISSIYFKKKDLINAYKYSKGLAAITLKHVYNEDIYDLRFIMRLAKVCFSQKDFGGYIYYATRIPYFWIMNKFSQNDKTLVAWN
jgi:hypothetical protein